MVQLNRDLHSNIYSSGVYDYRLKEVAKALRNGEKLDFNSLSFEDRQVVGALVESGEADYAIQDGRRMVQLSFLAQHPLLNFFVCLLSMGATGCIRLTTT